MMCLFRLSISARAASHARSAFVIFLAPEPFVDHHSGREVRQRNPVDAEQLSVGSLLFSCSTGVVSRTVAGRIIRTAQLLVNRQRAGNDNKKGPGFRTYSALKASAEENKKRGWTRVLIGIITLPTVERENE